MKYDADRNLVTFDSGRPVARVLDVGFQIDQDRDGRLYAEAGNLYEIARAMAKHGHPVFAEWAREVIARIDNEPAQPCVLAGGEGEG